MPYKDKDLDEDLWLWAQEILKAQDSGYPSKYILEPRVDHCVVFIPDYYPHPKICNLSNTIFALEIDKRNIIVAKYLLSWKIPKIAKYCDCHNATIYRKLNDARAFLLDEMRKFVYKNNRL